MRTMGMDDGNDGNEEWEQWEWMMKGLGQSGKNEFGSSRTNIRLEPNHRVKNALLYSVTFAPFYSACFLNCRYSSQRDT